MKYKYTVNLLISKEVHFDAQDEETADVMAVDWFTDSSFKDYETVGFEVLRHDPSNPRSWEEVQRFGMG